MISQKKYALCCWEKVPFKLLHQILYFLPFDFGEWIVPNIYKKDHLDIWGQNVKQNLDGS